MGQRCNPLSDSLASWGPGAPTCSSLRHAQDAGYHYYSYFLRAGFRTLAPAPERCDAKFPQCEHSTWPKMNSSRRIPASPIFGVQSSPVWDSGSETPIDQLGALRCADLTVQRALIPHSLLQPLPLCLALSLGTSPSDKVVLPWRSKFAGKIGHSGILEDQFPREQFFVVFLGWEKNHGNQTST